MEPKTQAAAQAMSPTHKRALANFDSLPDSAEVSVQVVAALMSVTTPTIWKWATSGMLPKPVRHGAVTRWKVAGIRQALAARG